MAIFSKVKTIFLLILVLGWSLVLGWKIALAVESDNSKLIQETYLQRCSTCHIPIPAEVLPTETWRYILENPEKHYGQKLPPFVGIERALIWKYLGDFSRPLLQGDGTPAYTAQSRYFKALHPKVTLPDPVTHQTCIACHPGAKQLDYVTLSPEWDN